MSDPAKTEATVADGDDAPALFDSLRALIDDSQTLAEAELAYQQVRARYALGRAKGIAAFVVLGLFLLFFTLVALVVGLLLALTPLVGAWTALGIVGVGLLAGTLICAMTAIKRITQLKRVLFAKEPPA
jgi:uncharacterized membrane protein